MIVFELLAEHHDLTRFHSGSSILDNYLQREALKEQLEDIARVFVAIDTDTNILQPVGYIALKTTGCFVSQRSDSAPSDTFLYPAEIACLARDLTWRGQGLGELLLLEALARIERASRDVGLPGVFLNATREGRALYERLRFERIEPSGQEYYLPMIVIREVLEEFGVR